MHALEYSLSIINTGLPLHFSEILYNMSAFNHSGLYPVLSYYPGICLEELRKTSQILFGIASFIDCIYLFIAPTIFIEFDYLKRGWGFAHNINVTRP
jgi:hypothetical protein